MGSYTDLYCYSSLTERAVGQRTLGMTSIAGCTQQDGSTGSASGDPMKGSTPRIGIVVAQRGCLSISTYLHVGQSASDRVEVFAKVCRSDIVEPQVLVSTTLSPLRAALTLETVAP